MIEEELAFSWAKDLKWNKSSSLDRYVIQYQVNKFLVSLKCAKYQAIFVTNNSTILAHYF